MSGGSMKIEMNGKGRYGIYNTKPISVHFLVMTDFEEDDNVALALIQEKDGKPDIQNYTMITMAKDNGVVVLSVKDCQNGTKDVLDNTDKFLNRRNRRRGRQINDDYKHVLNGEMYSVRFTETTKRLRFFRDSGPGFFHYYYGAKQTIHGQEASGWMELMPSKDWAAEGQKYYVALLTMGKGKAIFNNVNTMQKPRSDRDDRQTGFKIDRREYNWSGFFGDAVVVTFGEEFPFRDKDYKFTAWSEANYIPACPDTYSGYPIRYEIAWQSVNGLSSHWPVNERPFTGDNGSGATWDAEISHSCLLS